ncbi:hypothetical protein ACLI08_04765 [Flavobacterium sp. RNTU_13]|uniref:hypothetical protein n=1 Tax=Flavobacterium sp. RNTU_13 TaxID=3375145 RepID=UPI0039881754
MKNPFLLLTALWLLWSCGAKKVSLWPYVAVFKSDESPNIPATYIILKNPAKSYEMYSPLLYTSIIGEWKQAHDTLYLYPKYELQNKSDGLLQREITQKDSTMLTVMHTLLVKPNELIDITRYDTIFKEFTIFLPKTDGTIYKRTTQP